jgi:hypothetical protein
MSRPAPRDVHRSAVDAIRAGDVESLEALLAEHPSLTKARPDRAQTLLHVVTDWPGHFPRGAETVAALARAGAEPDARFIGRHGETPLHWAASSDDVAVLDALLDAGAVHRGGRRGDRRRHRADQRPRVRELGRGPPAAVGGHHPPRRRPPHRREGRGGVAAHQRRAPGGRPPVVITIRGAAATPRVDPAPHIALMEGL